MNDRLASFTSGGFAIGAITVQHASAAAAIAASLIAALAGLPVVVERYAPRSRLGRWFASRKTPPIA